MICPAWTVTTVKQILPSLSIIVQIVAEPMREKNKQTQKAVTEECESNYLSRWNLFVVCGARKLLQVAATAVAIQVRMLAEREKTNTFESACLPLRREDTLVCGVWKSSRRLNGVRTHSARYWT